MIIKNLVLGAGIAGISAANALNKMDTLVIEKENHYGGLCNSFKINDFLFDSAIHLSFSNLKDVRNIFDKTQYYKHLPIAYNYKNNLWLKHPVENNLFNLSNYEKIKCIKGFVEKPMFKAIINYEQWLIATYGEDIYHRFHEIYTYKYWCKQANELSTDWVGKRLNIPDIEKVLYGSFHEETGIDYYAKEMRYPKSGGYKAFLDPMMKNINLELRRKIKKISLKEKIVYFEDETNYKYENLISSIPLPEIISLIDDVSSDVIEASNRLMATSIALVSVGFNKPNVSPYLWFYIYDKDILPARVYSPSKKSEFNAPNGCSSLQFEIYYTKEKPLNKSSEELIDHIKESMIKMNLCKEEDIIFMDYRCVEYGNIIFYKGMEEDRKIVKDFLEKNDVNLIGRFGEWDYLWSDQSFMSGKNAAKKLIYSLNNKK